MQSYFKNVLMGFIPEGYEIQLDTDVRMTPDFLVIDVDQDDMPEILFAFRYDKHRYVGVLKRKEKRWYLYDVNSAKIDTSNGVLALVNVKSHIRLTPKDKGRVVMIDDLFVEESNGFVGMIDNAMYYGKLIPCEKDKKDEAGDEQVIDFLQADVTGDGYLEYVSLVGEKKFGDLSGYTTALSLQVQMQSCEAFSDSSIPHGEGYGARLFAGDFTGSGKSDVLVIFYKDIQGTKVQGYMYRFDKEEPTLIFDVEKYNRLSTGKITYKDNYKVEVVSDILETKYMIDLSDKGNVYLQEIYDQKGRLKQEKYGKLSEVIAINPVDFDGNRIYKLSIIQRIEGIYEGDTLGLLDTYLRWDESLGRFIPSGQYVSLIGKPM